MKIEIHGQPVFLIELSVPQLEVLLQLSESHYEGKCKAASRQGGFLYGWRNTLVVFPEMGTTTPEVPPVVEASGDELGTCLKLLEMAGSLYLANCISEDRPHLDIAVELVRRFRKALTVAAQAAQGWTTFIEWEEPK